MKSSIKAMSSTNAQSNTIGSSATTIRSTTIAASDFRKVIKRDKSHYKELKDEANARGDF